jgi:hypothetical protein
MIRRMLERAAYSRPVLVAILIVAILGATAQGIAEGGRAIARRVPREFRSFKRYWRDPYEPPRTEHSKVEQ